jgi:hypothetical protein
MKSNQSRLLISHPHGEITPQPIVAKRDAFTHH